MIAMMKRWAIARGKENKSKPVMKIIINAGYDTRVARAFIDEMNKGAVARNQRAAASILCKKHRSRCFQTLASGVKYEYAKTDLT